MHFYYIILMPALLTKFISPTNNGLQLTGQMIPTKSQKNEFLFSLQD